MREPFYHVAGGLQDNGVWTGPSRVRGGAILSRDWRFIQNGDGYYAVSHPDDPELFLSDYQAGGIQATNMRTYEQREASPQVKRMDGYPADSNKVRFNWNAPIFLLRTTRWVLPGIVYGRWVGERRGPRFPRPLEG
jgi:hypothetical protein